jgi:hypothetical protein
VPGTSQVAVAKAAAPAPAVATAAVQSGATTLAFAVAASGWADVHYTVNGGSTQTVRMRQDGKASRYTAGGLKKGDVVEVRFTYWDGPRGHAVDTAPRTVVIQ